MRLKNLFGGGVDIYNKAKMFNKKASNPKNKPDRVLDALELGRGQKIADIGAGGGYFSLRFAELVGGKGCVYAVDTNPEFLEFIRREAEKRSLNNIKPIRAGENGLILPGRSLDLIFLRNAYHHLPDRVGYFRNLSGLLKPKGRVAIIEYRGGGFNFHSLFGHYVPFEIIVKEMEEAGYRVKRKFDFLPEQSFTIFVLQR